MECLMMVRVVSITRKGQATIPKDLRDKFGLKDKALVLEAEEGVLFKPLPTPEADFGSLKRLFEEKTSKELLEEARTPDLAKERRLQRRVKG
jgi:AbrB family looped-hinge helix DNA binding protein